jgi:REP element-mobilizing transposase RayT
MDRYLDTACKGPMFLRNPTVADLVVNAIERGATLGAYDLKAFAVMGNHVHVLLRANRNVSTVLQWLKGGTAHEANKLLGQTGRPFWQRESYDHWVRDERELERIAGYIENNPVKAGLVNEPSQYPWSSASSRRVGLKPAAAR